MVGIETTKLKSANIISPATCNDVMHAVALLAPPSGASTLPVLFLVNLQTHGFIQVSQARDGNTS